MSNEQPKESAQRVSVSLFAEHDDIVRRFAEESHRTYSNAMQVIITEWHRMTQQPCESGEHKRG